MTPPATEPTETPAQRIPLDIRYEDSALLVLEKPAGLAVHPGAGHPDGTLVNALLAHCGDSLSGIGGVQRPGIVHRLDMDTSGLMVVAKTDRTHEALSAQFAARSIDRLYLSLVWGTPQPPEGEIDAPIGRHPRNRLKMAVVAEGRGRNALTHYATLRRYAATATLLSCKLATGRTHQIRVHLSEKGHPLLGDRLYGRTRASRRQTLNEAAAEALEALGRQALHATTLGFDHPETGESLRFSSDPPADMAALLTALDAA